MRENVQGVILPADNKGVICQRGDIRHTAWITPGGNPNFSAGQQAVLRIQGSEEK
jgi:hypothetical protein